MTYNLSDSLEIRRNRGDFIGRVNTEFWGVRLKQTSSTVTAPICMGQKPGTLGKLYGSLMC